MVDHEKASSTGGAPECSSFNPFERPKYDVRLLLLATALAAVWLALWPTTSVGGRVIMAVFSLTYLFGCYATRRGVLFVFPAMYLPVVAAYISLDGQSWGSRWRGGFDLWLHPGCAVSLFLGPSSSSWFLSGAVLSTVVFFLIAVSFARASRWMTVVTALIVLLASSINCWLVFAMLARLR